MFPLTLPSFNAKIQFRNGKNEIFDVIRKRYVTLTPEEWVRQHFVNFLIHYKHYPSGLLANEVSIRLNGTTKRCDTVLFHKTLQPRMIIEYKAPQINISQETCNQITRYNMSLKVEYLIISNGVQHYCYHINYKNNNYDVMTDIPDYSLL